MRYKTPVLVLSLLVLGSAAASAAEAPERPVVFSEGRLSVHVRSMPLAEVLERISRLSGIRIRFDDSAASQARDELTTVTFAGVPLEEGLRRVLKSKDVVFAYSARGIDEVRIYGARARPASESQPSAGVPLTENRVRAGEAMARAAEARQAEEVARLPRLRNEVVSHPDPRRRLSALERLVATADQNTTAEVLSQVLERESDRAVLEGALDSIGDQTAIPLESLLRLALSQKESSVRVKALQRLGAHGGKDPRVPEALRTLLNDPASGVRNTAQQLLNDLAKN